MPLNAYTKVDMHLVSLNEQFSGSESFFVIFDHDKNILPARKKMFFVFSNVTCTVNTIAGESCDALTNERAFRVGAVS